MRNWYCLAGLLALIFSLGYSQPVEPPTSVGTPSALAEGVAAAAPAAVERPAAVMLEPQGFTQRVHDPVLAHEDDMYYLFHSGARGVILKSPDLVNWEWSGRIFDKNPPWGPGVNPDFVDLWAPDISYFNGKWHVYYSISSMGSQNSAIGLATNTTLNPDSPDYAWVEEGIVLQSHIGEAWNAIDPNLVLDEEGNPWLVWGSYWQGIYMRRLDAATGKFLETDDTVHHIAQRTRARDGDESLEGAFIVSHDGMWYLFASFDHCCMGNASTYNVRVGRSETITGPYVDRDGVPMLEGGGTHILDAYGNWVGPGHNGLLMNDDGPQGNGIDWIVYHAYDKRTSMPRLRVESIAWDDEGWPSLPSQTQGK